MESKAKIFGHAIHPVLIVFPLGLLSAAVVFDIVYLIWGNIDMSKVAYWMIVSGIVGGFLAAPFGWIDWFAIPSATRAKSVGLLHGAVNVTVLLIFIASWWLRSYDAPNRTNNIAYILSFAAVALALVGGWLGGELVERLGVSVDDGANLNAPSSLSSSSTARNASKTTTNF